jgi:hypothetical protein
LAAVWYSQQLNHNFISAHIIQTTTLLTRIPPSEPTSKMDVTKDAKALVFAAKVSPAAFLLDSAPYSYSFRLAQAPTEQELHQVR